MVAPCAFSNLATNKNYVTLVRGNLDVTTILTLDTKEERGFEQLWGTDVVGVEEQDYHHARANFQRNTFVSFLPVYAVLAKWCTAVAHRPHNNHAKQ